MTRIFSIFATYVVGLLSILFEHSITCLIRLVWSLFLLQIHHSMSGRIKLLQGANPVNPMDDPPLGYDYKLVDNDFDQSCGTYGLNPFQLPHDECPERFVCQDEVAVSRRSVSPSLTDFAHCLDAMDCHMMVGMTTGINSGSEAVLFIHQMIPHHQNGVNMAKALLKTNTLDCASVTDQDDNPDCVLESVIRSIIVDQNHQIQLMQAYLEAKGYNETDDCVVSVAAKSSTTNNNQDENDHDLDNVEDTSAAAMGAFLSLWSWVTFTCWTIVLGLSN